jgi:protein-tyrosine-phosphatase
MPGSLLIVCRANLCRSPMAEAVFADLSAKAGLGWVLDSAGTEVTTPGQPPDPRVMTALGRVGLTTSHRARPVVAEDFSRFQRILAADRRVLAGLQAQRPAGATAVIGYLGDHDPEGEREVADPYFTVGELPFRALLDHLQRSAKGWATAGI